MVAAKPVVLTRSATNPSSYDPEPLIVVGTIPAGSGPAGTNIVASGRATLVAGTVTVATAYALTASVILITANTLGTVAAPKALAVTARSNGVSFTVTSSDATETSSIGWAILA
jgi:hypothetical protein